jgi:hypothetical protein
MRRNESRWGFDWHRGTLVIRTMIAARLPEGQHWRLEARSGWPRRQGWGLRAVHAAAAASSREPAVNLVGDYTPHRGRMHRAVPRAPADVVERGRLLKNDRTNAWGGVVGANAVWLAGREGGPCGWPGRAAATPDRYDHGTVWYKAVGTSAACCIGVN